MNIHKKFCEELGKLRQANIRDIVVSLGVVNLEGHKIVNLYDTTAELEQIFYTVDYLEENKLVLKEIVGMNDCDFNPENFIKDGYDKYKISQMHAMPEYLRKYWNIKLTVYPIYAKFVYNGYRTDEEVEKNWNRWLPFITAIVASLVTAILTALLTESLIIIGF